jgi:hypothetical protein
VKYYLNNFNNIVYHKNPRKSRTQKSQEWKLKIKCLLGLLND